MAPWAVGWSLGTDGLGGAGVGVVAHARGVTGDGGSLAHMPVLLRFLRVQGLEVSPLNISVGALAPSQEFAMPHAHQEGGSIGHTAYLPPW